MLNTNLIQGTVQVAELKDKELVEMIKAGHTDLYSELVKRHQKNVFRVVVKMVKDASLAEDVTQDAFLKGYTKFHLFIANCIQ